MTKIEQNITQNKLEINYLPNFFKNKEYLFCSDSKLISNQSDIDFEKLEFTRELPSFPILSLPLISGCLSMQIINI
jgi:hypothetical protein